MGYDRKRVIQHVAAHTVQTVCAHTPALVGKDLSPILAGAESETDALMLELRNLDKAEELADAHTLFQAATPDESLALKRKMARRAGEARSLTQWITAEMVGRTANECEQYRKASAMRTNEDTVLDELAQLCQRLGLDLVECKMVKGKLAKSKASHPAVMAWNSLKNAIDARDMQNAKKAA